jgi:hypothetical protein
MHRRPLPRLAALALSLSLSTVSLASAQETAPPAAVKTDAKSDLPSADSLFAQEVAARGGKEALDAVQHMTSRGTIEFRSANINGSIVVRLSNPSNFLTTVELEKIGTIRTGYNGTHGWSMDPMLGPRLLEGSELEQIRTEASFSSQSSIQSRYAESKVTKLGDWNGKPAYEIALKSPDREATMYIDKETSLVLGMKYVMESIRGRLPVTASFSEYKEFAGPKGAIKIPIRTEMVMMGMTNVLTFDSIDFDPIAPDVFALPAEIKTLTEAPPPAPAATPAPTPAPTPANSPAAPTVPTPPVAPAAPPTQPK